MNRKSHPAASRRLPEPGSEWNVRDAKAQLSKVVSGALERPQRIARRDGAAVVVMSESAYRALLDRAQGEVDMVDYFRAHAIAGPALQRRARRPARPAAKLR
jgi:hypothetical protein